MDVGGEYYKWERGERVVGARGSMVGLATLGVEWEGVVGVGRVLGAQI